MGRRSVTNGPSQRQQPVTSVSLEEYPVEGVLDHAKWTVGDSSRVRCKPGAGRLMGPSAQDRIQFCFLFERAVVADCILGSDAVLAFMSFNHCVPGLTITPFNCFALTFTRAASSRSNGSATTTRRLSASGLVGRGGPGLSETNVGLEQFERTPL